jgi:signal transduction histidine kinase
MHLIPFSLSILFIAFASTEESFRIILMSFIISFLYLGGAIFLFRVKDSTKIQHLAGYFSLAIAIIYLFRSIWVLYFNPIANLFSGNFIQTGSYMLLFLSSLSWTIVLLLIQREKNEEIIKNSNLKLNELNKSKDKFFSIISHDLRSPLSSSCQIGDILMTKYNEYDEVKREALTKELYMSSKQSLNLLDSLLMWASSNSGLMEFKPEKISITKIINENLNIFKTVSELKCIKLESTIKADFLVIADYAMINTVVRNLLSNAIKFTPKSGQIKIILEEMDNIINVGVADSGVGMNKDDISKVFKIDSNLKGIGTENEKGTGLGLKLCKEFIDKHNSKLWIESEINTGTTVWFSLPKLHVFKNNNLQMQ